MSEKNPLRAKRKELHLTQKEFAAILDCSPRTVTELEKMNDINSTIFKKYMKRISEFQTNKHGKIHNVSDHYSWKQDTFDLLRLNREIPNRADAVIVKVDLQISDDPQFIKHGMSVTFEGLYTDDTPEGLLVDAVSHPRADLKVTLVEPKDQDLRGLEFNPQDSKAQNVVCYQLKGADPVNVPRIMLNYDADFAAEIGDWKPDAMGFAVPADLMLNRVEVEIVFHGIEPIPKCASSRPFPIRRYANSARPERFTSDDVPPPILKSSDQSSSSYWFELLRPKPGYGYVIGWSGLKRI